MCYHQRGRSKRSMVDGGREGQRAARASCCATAGATARPSSIPAVAIGGGAGARLSFRTGVACNQRRRPGAILFVSAYARVAGHLRDTEHEQRTKPLKSLALPSEG